MVPVGGGKVSSLGIMLEKHVTYLFLRSKGPVETREQTWEVVGVVEDQDQRCRRIVDEHLWLCGPAFQLVRNTRTPFETTI